MKITIFILLLLGITMGVKAENQITVSDFQGANIKGIRVSGAFHIKIQQGENTGAKLDIPARFKEQLIFVLRDNGVLEIGFKGTIQGKNDDRFIAEIECSSLEKINLSGACQLIGEGNFTASRLQVELSGATHTTIKGNLIVEDALDLGSSGSSEFTSNIQASRLNIGLSGASKLTLRGRATDMNLALSGASKVSMENCAVMNVSIATSGASKASINALERLSFSGSGASKVRYCGNPKLSVKTSGAASVSRI